MERKMKNPAVQGGVRCASDWRHNPNNNPPNDETQQLPGAGGPGDLVTGQRLDRLIERVHLLGPRALAELLAEIATATGEPGLIADRVEAYAGLDPEIVRFVGGDRFPPMPLELVK